MMKEFTTPESGMPWNNNSRAFNMREYAIIKMMGIRQIIIN
jgi:hypothetical protein